MNAKSLLKHKIYKIILYLRQLKRAKVTRQLATDATTNLKVSKISEVWTMDLNFKCDATWAYYFDTKMKKIYDITFKES